MDRFGVVLLALVGATALFQTAQAIMFGLEPNTQKCLKDDMQGNQIVAGEYEVTGAPGQKINYVVRFRISPPFKGQLVNDPDLLSGAGQQGPHHVPEGGHQQGQVHLHQ